MTSVLAHRGPDDCGYYHTASGSRRLATFSDKDLQAAGTASSQPGVALGHRRLSIIDLAGGQQPLCNEDGTVWIVFNGEIYNYRELQSELKSRGHRFHSDADTETIVHLYEEHGADCVQYLRGMFAFAIWDDRKKSLLLARDRLGQKPLLYRQENDRLLFASELKSLLQVPGLPRELDCTALDAYLTYQYVPHPQTMLRGFRKLPPAHQAVYRDGKLTLQRYWEPGYDAGEIRPGGRDWKEATDLDTDQIRVNLRETLTEAVRLRLRSDVPLGAFLSGGVDSTIIVGLMQELSDRSVQTFSIGFPVESFDERDYARQAAAHLGTEHHEQIVEPAALKILPRLIWHYDEPFADSSAIPTMYLSEMTRRNVTVALSGDGGDELFAGYERYRAVQLAERFDRLPRFVQKMLTAKIWQRIPASVAQKSRRRRLKRLLAALGEPRERRYLKWVCIFDDERRSQLYTPEFKQKLGGADAAEFLLQAYDSCDDRDFVTRTTCADVLTYLPCDILNKVDRASMASSLECRSPFLDHRVAELAAQLPLAAKLRGGKGKRILVETFADLIPEQIQGRKKMGFGVPLDHWFRNELSGMLTDVLLDPSALARGIFRSGAVEQLISEHGSRKWDHSYRLWSLLCLELWQRMFLDTDVPSTPPDQF